MKRKMKFLGDYCTENSTSVKSNSYDCRSHADMLCNDSRNQKLTSDADV